MLYKFLELNSIWSKTNLSMKEVMSIKEENEQWIIKFYVDNMYLLLFSITIC
jgi:hypothetical protein